MNLKDNNWVLALAIVALVLVVTVPLIYVANSKPKIDANTVSIHKLKSGWSVTSDIASNIDAISCYVLTDPQGQKFLIVNHNSNMCVLPYKEIK